MTTIEMQGMVNGLSTRKGAQFVTIVAKTVPAMNKKGNPYWGRLVKVARVNGVVNWNYQKAVNRQREREDVKPDFEALPRAWGVRLAGLPFVEHNGKLYLEVKVERSIEYTYLVDGVEVNADEVTPYLRPASSNPRQRIEKEVILRDYALDTIQSLTVGGMAYLLANADLTALRDCGIIAVSD